MWKVVIDEYQNSVNESIEEKMEYVSKPLISYEISDEKDI